MKRVSIKDKWNNIKKRILAGWIDFFYIFNILLKNFLLALFFNLFLWIIRSLLNISGQHWFSEAISYIHEVSSILLFLLLTMIELYDFLKVHFSESRRSF